MHRLAAMLLALFAPFAAGAQRRAPPLDARQLPPGAFDLTQSWRVHEGDNSAWADPDFDDSVWATESLDSRSASAQGWRWFRVSVRLPQASTIPLSLLIDGRDGAYELFMDGQRVPGPSLRSPLLVTDPRDRSFPFTRPAAVVHLALRVHIAKRLFDRAAAFHSVALAPAPVVAAKQHADNDARLMSSLPSLGINLALLLAGIGALGLYFAQKGRGEYLWLGVFLAALGGGAAAFGLYYSSVVPVSITGSSPFRSTIRPRSLSSNSSSDSQDAASAVRGAYTSLSSCSPLLPVRGSYGSGFSDTAPTTSSKRW